MRIRIAARKSDLARLQAKTVGAALQVAHPGLKIEYHFRASLGDINQNDPLWKMPEKGVFTEDFLADLISGQCDLVVHSWKDLPVATRESTEIAATMARADCRDLFLFRKDQWETVKTNGRIRILTSSPRRSHNLQNFFPGYLPFAVHDVEFIPVRGNIPTRLQKLFDQDVDGLIVAKAAIDRLLGTPDAEFADVAAFIRNKLKSCLWMALPLTVNPTAAAQGALAIEINSQRDDLKHLLQAIQCRSTFDCVSREREILASYGGGCHQKIGVTALRRDYGDVLFLRGETDKGETLNALCLETDRQDEKPQSSQAMWPESGEESAWFTREPLPPNAYEAVSRSPFLFIARESALPADLEIKSEQIVWTAGLKTWKKLAARGVWVNGSSESLGEVEPARIETLLAQPSISWVKLTHERGPEHSKTTVPTYRLVPRKTTPDLRGKTHFFWSSGTSFEEALKKYPEIRSAHHACGPGNTYQCLRTHLGESARISIYLSYEDWRRDLLT